MRPIDRTLVRSVLLPANLIVVSLVVFGVLASNLEADLRRVPPRVEPGRSSGDLADPGKTGRLTVKVTGARSAAGKIVVWLFARGPLTDGANVVAGRSITPAPAGSLAVFDRLPRKAYAVVAVHDENGNGQLDVQAGVPTEGIGQSGAAPAQGPPTFEGARITLDREAAEIEVPLRYR